MRKLRPCVRKLLAGDHPASLGLRPLAILLACQGSSPLPWPPFGHSAQWQDRSGCARHTWGRTPVCKRTVRAATCGWSGCALHKGVRPEAKETRNLAPTLPSQLCALVQGCVCLEKMCLFLILTQALQGLAGLPGRRTCLQGKDWSKALR